MDERAGRGFSISAVTVLLVALSGVAGCSVSVDKTKDGEDKNVKIDTPLGGLHVRSNDVTASDLGLPVYPGAKVYSGKDGNKSADVHFGFGEWQFRLKVVTYQTPDTQRKVLEFYRKALGRYGDVIECQDKVAVGTPTMTREGLTCKDDGEHHPDVNIDQDHSLKAGSKRHQHIVGVEKGDGDTTRFSLVQVELPSGSPSKEHESN